MKHHVIFPVEQKNLALRRAQLAAKSSRELYGGKSSTDNDHSDWLHSLLLWPGDVCPAFLPAHAHPLLQGGERHFGVLAQDRRRTRLRISESSKFCSKWTAEWWPARVRELLIALPNISNPEAH